jgi:hypothetical protein
MLLIRASTSTDTAPSASVRATHRVKSNMNHEPGALKPGDGLEEDDPDRSLDDLRDSYEIHRSILDMRTKPTSKPVMSPTSSQDVATAPACKGPARHIYKMVELETLIRKRVIFAKRRLSGAQDNSTSGHAERSPTLTELYVSSPQLVLSMMLDSAFVLLQAPRNLPEADYFESLILGALSKLCMLNMTAEMLYASIILPTIKVLRHYPNKAISLLATDLLEKWEPLTEKVSEDDTVYLTPFFVQHTRTRSLLDAITIIPTPSQPDQMWDTIVATTSPIFVRSLMTMVAQEIKVSDKLSPNILVALQMLEGLSVEKEALATTRVLPALEKIRDHHCKDIRGKVEELLAKWRPIAKGRKPAIVGPQVVSCTETSSAGIRPLGSAATADGQTSSSEDSQPHTESRSLQAASVKKKGVIGDPQPCECATKRLTIGHCPVDQTVQNPNDWLITHLRVVDTMWASHAPRTTSFESTVATWPDPNLAPLTTSEPRPKYTQPLELFNHSKIF